MNTTVGQIYDLIDSFAPFSGQQSYDNSGLVVGSRDSEVLRALTALDITNDVVREAAEKRCQLIISHHPVIFRPLKKLDPREPAVALAAKGIAAICAHTSFDSAEGGMNDLLAQRLGLKVIEPLAYEEGKPMGYVCVLPFESSASHLAEVCKKKLGCEVIRMTKAGGSVKRAAICSGSGASLISEAIAKGCDALITGDCKHSAFIEAVNSNFCLIDAGHYHTENIFHEFIAQKLTEEFPTLTVMQSEAFTDPVTIV